MTMLKVSVTKKSDGVFVVSPCGAIDSETYSILQNKIDEFLKQLPRVLVFDMAGVNYMSSMGIKVVLHAREIVEKGGGLMLLTNLQPQIAKVFDIIKAIPTHNIFSSVGELDRYLANIQQKEIEKRRPHK